MLEKEQVVILSNDIEQATSSLFEVKKLDTTVQNLLPGFQKGKEAFSGFEITSLDNDKTYRFIFIRSQNENYHLMIFSPNKQVLAELKQIEIIDGTPHLVWKYNPLKRDGMNARRKEYFKNKFGSLSLQIPLPTSSADIEAFFNQLFTLCQNRQEADYAVEG
jgi:hypothetical protein